MTCLSDRHASTTRSSTPLGPPDAADRPTRLTHRSPGTFFHRERCAYRARNLSASGGTCGHEMTMPTNRFFQTNPKKPTGATVSGDPSEKRSQRDPHRGRRSCRRPLSTAGCHSWLAYQCLRRTQCPPRPRPAPVTRCHTVALKKKGIPKRTHLKAPLRKSANAAGHVAPANATNGDGTVVQGIV